MLWPFATSLGEGSPHLLIALEEFGVVLSRSYVFLHLFIRSLEFVELIPKGELRGTSSVLLVVVGSRANSLVPFRSSEAFLL